MTKGRLEAFSDGVLAIIITIMVLELKVPHGDDWATLVKVWPVFVSYILSFIYVGIYWNNHHHLFAASRRIDGAIMWANLQGRILAGESTASALRAQIGFDLKGKISPVLYIGGIATSFFVPWLAWALFAFVAFMARA